MPLTPISSALLDTLEFSGIRTSCRRSRSPESPSAALEYHSRRLAFQRQNQDIHDQAQAQGPCLADRRRRVRRSGGGRGGGPKRNETVVAHRPWGVAGRPAAHDPEELANEREDPVQEHPEGGSQDQLDSQSGQTSTGRWATYNDLPPPVVENETLPVRAGWCLLEVTTYCKHILSGKVNVSDIFIGCQEAIGSSSQDDSLEEIALRIDQLKNNAAAVEFLTIINTIQFHSKLLW